MLFRSFVINEHGMRCDLDYIPQEELEIKKPKRFYGILKSDIGIGPNCRCAMLGVTQGRLKILKRIVESGDICWLDDFYLSQKEMKEVMRRKKTRSKKKTT